METFIKDLRRILDEYEAREKQKTEVLTGTVKFTNLGSLVGDSRPSERLVFHTNGECVMNISDGLKSFQQSLQDVNAAGQLSSGVEELSLYIEHILNTNEELKKRLEEKSKRIIELCADIERKDQKIKEIARDYNRMLKDRDGWKKSAEDLQRAYDKVINENIQLENAKYGMSALDNEYLRSSITEEIKIRMAAEETIREKEEVIANMTKEIEKRDQKIKELARDYNRLLELKDRWEAMVICRPHPDKLIKEYEELVRRQNKLISDLRDQIKGEGKVDRFEAGIEKLNEIVGILDQWRNDDCRNRQKAVKSERDGGPVE